MRLILPTLVAVGLLIANSATAQIVEPKKTVPASPPLVYDVDETQPPVGPKTIESCVFDADAREVIAAYVLQTKQHDKTSCGDNDYFRRSQIRTYILGLVNQTPIENVQACSKLNDALISTFGRAERKSARGASCEPSYQKCVVQTRGGVLNFRHFPHVNNVPSTLTNLSTRKDTLENDTTVIVGSTYRGWAYVSAIGIKKGSATAGWISQAHLGACE